MATSNKFLREPKMSTTEPSADEAGAGMKRGGKMRGYAKGGEVESKAEEKREDREMKKVEKELKHHESMKAGKAHHGLKKGGMPPMRSMAPKAGPDQMGGLAGGLSATRPVRKPMSGGIEMTGYKKGGEALAKKMESFGVKGTLKPKINVKDKVVTAKKLAGYKDGGQVGHKAMKCESHGGFMHMKKGGKLDC